MLLFRGLGDGIPTKIDYIGAGGRQIFLVPPSLHQKRHGLNRENDDEEADSGGQCQVNNKGGVSPISSGHRWAGT